MRVEVVWAERDAQRVIVLSLPDGATLREALAAAAVRPEFRGIEVERMPVGVFGRRIEDPAYVLADGDRVELYRPLTADPMSARRARVNRRAVE